MTDLCDLALEKAIHGWAGLPLASLAPRRRHAQANPTAAQ